MKQEGIPATDKICGKVACDVAKTHTPVIPARVGIWSRPFLQ
nr:hypothetical protein [Neisseria meningitidis]